MQAVACTMDRLHVDATTQLPCLLCVQVEELQQLVLKVQPLAYKSEDCPGLV